MRAKTLRIINNDEKYHKNNIYKIKVKKLICRFSFRYRSKEDLNGDYIYRRNTSKIKEPRERDTLFLIITRK